MSDQFEHGDLVWAKMKGYPAWPAQVVKPQGSPKKNQHWIYFFGSDNYAWIEKTQIKDFFEYEDKFSNRPKTAGFKQAMKKIKDYIEAKKEDPNYELELPQVKEPLTPTSKELTEEEIPKKAVKRLSKDSSKSPMVPTKKSKKRSSSFEENGTSFHEGSTDDADIPVTSDRSTPKLFETIVDGEESPETSTSLTFGFLGLGVMGTGIVKNLINSGRRINLWNRTLSKCEEMKKNHKTGLVEVYETPYEVVLNSDVIFSCVSDAKAAEANLMGNLGVLVEGNSFKGKGYVEMTGIDPETSTAFCKEVHTRGGSYLEVQLQGSKQEAEEGNLVVLTAGDRSLFDKCRMCFKAIGKTAFFLGNVGYAVKMNMVINLIKSISLVGLSEAFGFAERSGLSTKNVLEIFKDTSITCPYLECKADKMNRRDFQNPEHALQHMQKDIKLCLDLANNLKQPLLMASTANEILKHARRLGYDGQDCSSVFMRSKF